MEFKEIIAVECTDREIVLSSKQAVEQFMKMLENNQDFILTNGASGEGQLIIATDLLSKVKTSDVKIKYRGFANTVPR